MLYLSNGLFATPRALSGASLAQLVRRMSAPERAVLAADILDGRVVLQGLTAKSIAEIIGVSSAYVSAALRSTPEQREAIKRGERPLVPARATPRPAPIDWSVIDDHALVEAVRLIGVNRTLDAAVAAEITTT